MRSRNLTTIRQPATEGMDVVYNGNDWDFFIDGQYQGSRALNQDAWQAVRAIYFDQIEADAIAASDEADTCVVLNREENEYEIYVGGELIGAEPTREAAEAALKAITSADAASPACLVEYLAGDCGLMVAGRDDLTLAIGTHCLPIGRNELLALRELLNLPGVALLMTI